MTGNMSCEEVTYHFNLRSLFGGKAIGLWRRPPTTPSAEVKERIKLYLYFPWAS
jgi:hypothetical protein